MATGAAIAALGLGVADHGFAAIAIALWCFATIVFALGAAVAVIDVRAERQRLKAEAEQQRRAAILDQLRRQYSRAYRSQWIASILASGPGGRGRLPKPWVDEQLEKMGETWRQDRYL
jgi:hypothetical protein